MFNRNNRTSHLSTEWNVIHSLLKECSLFVPYNTEVVFIEKSIRRLYSRMLMSTLNNVINLDPILKDSLTTDIASVNASLGLKDIILNALTSGKKKYLKVVYNEKLQSISYENVYTPNKNNSQDVLVIDTSMYPSTILWDFYALIYKFIHNSNNALQLSNKPVFYTKLFNEVSSSFEMEQLINQVQTLVSSLKTNEGFGVADEKAKLEILQTDPNKYKILVDTGYGGVAHFTGLTIGFVSGQAKTNLANTGDGDIKQNEEAFYSMYTDLLEPIFKRIYSVVGLNNGKYDVFYKEYVKGEMLEMLQVADRLDRINSIDPEVKKNKIIELLNLK